jgi:hypothetical protein
MKKFATIRNFLILIPVLIIVSVLSYGLPQVDVLRAVGVEIKRVDEGVNEAGQQRTRDVYQLQMETPGGQPRVYRNEDNYLYLKFDSASLQAQVQSLAADKQLVALRHYGIRIPLFSLFPNAVKVWPVEEGYRHLPVFNTLVFLGLGLLAFLGVRRVRRLSDARSEQRRVRDAERAEAAALAARETERATQQRRDAERKKASDLDDFLGNDDAKKD